MLLLNVLLQPCGIEMVVRCIISWAASVSAIMIVGRKWINYFPLWFRRVGRFLWTRSLLLETGRHLDSWQTTSWANQLKTFIGDTFGMYKISLSNQKKNVWRGRRDERKKGAQALWVTFSSIGTKAAESRHLCSQTMTQVHEGHHKVIEGSCHALTSNQV